MRRRETYNFAEEEQKPMNAEELDSAVATANLISIMDPKEIGDEEVKLISDATGASEGFVDEMADACNDACEECAAGKDAEEVKANFSAAAENIITNYVESANFSAPASEEDKTAEDKVLEIAQLTTLIDDDVLKNSPTEEVVETIAEATQTPEEVVEPIVENAKEQFSNGNEMYLDVEDVANFCNFAKKTIEEAIKNGTEGKVTNKMLKKGNLFTSAWDKVKSGAGKVKDVTVKAGKAVGGHLGRNKKVYLIGAGVATAGGLGYGAYKKAHKKNFSEGEVEEVIETPVTETIVPEPTTLPAEGAVKEGVSDTQPVEATAQNPVKAAEMDPKEGEKVQDTTTAEAALKVQNDLATVESVADVTPAQTNFGRQNLKGSKEATDGLRSLLGSRYIPNK